jgi:hypothetical protein
MRFLKPLKNEAAYHAIQQNKYKDSLFSGRISSLFDHNFIFQRFCSG